MTTSCIWYPLEPTIYSGANTGKDKLQVPRKSSQAADMPCEPLNLPGESSLLDAPLWVGALQSPCASWGV